MKELNGFKIDKYNQYGLKERDKLSTCPKCSEHRKKKKDKCLMVNWDIGIATCQHCGEVLQMHTYKRSEEQKVYVKPKWKNETDLSENLVKWFEGRGIDQATLVKMKISEGPEWMPQTQGEVNTVQFNYFMNDELINVKYRTGDKHFKLHKGSEKIFYNIESIRHTDEAIICEGEMDALSFVECGVDNVVSVPNGATTGNVNLDYLDSCYQFFENKTKIYLATDNDEPGLNLRAELIRRLGAEKCYLIDFDDCKDANDYMIKYGKSELPQVLNQSTACPLENILTMSSEKEQLRDFYINGAAKGNIIGMPKFDRIFSTYTGQFIVVTGIPGSGKSDWVDMMTTGYNKQHGWKTAYCSPENKPSFLHLDKICRKYYGKYPQEADLDKVSWTKVEEKVNDNFFFIDYDAGYNLTDTLKKAEELVKRKGIKVLVIDPFNKVRMKESLHKGVNDYTNDYLLEIDTFCRKHDILIILVAHPIKQMPNKETGEIPVPTFYSVKGGGEFYDMSPHGLLVHRNKITNTVMVKVLKIKFFHLGDADGEVNFAWSPNNGRYCDIEGEPGQHEVIWDNTNWITEEENSMEQKPIEFNDDFLTQREDGEDPF